MTTMNSITQPTVTKPWSNEMYECRFGDGFTIGEIWERCLKELDRVPNYWLNQEWDYAVHLGLVSDCVKFNFVGY